ncbi:hypothetical protein [Sanguibacter antarcticus]|uniref:hypothetical protein n=1 Tax=Sanguibacter antarcticus TaxID=372484 RepID=UPI001179F2EB|nr:hypothetical protein [Sanguibacter antarcticus]
MGGPPCATVTEVREAQRVEADDSREALALDRLDDELVDRRQPATEPGDHLAPDGVRHGHGSLVDLGRPRKTEGRALASEIGDHDAAWAVQVLRWWS